MSYETAITRMYALGHELAQTPSHTFDLAHMRALLAALNHPQQRFPGVLIAGTNGKGSTAATLAAILQASGLRTGLYTSPHVVRINERIQINGQQISDDDFAGLHDVVDRTAERLVSEGELPWHPSFFEMLTAIAFEYFAQAKVEIAVLEVGMGGRLDATRVRAEPPVPRGRLSPHLDESRPPSPRRVAARCPRVPLLCPPPLVLLSPDFRLRGRPLLPRPDKRPRIHGHVEGLIERGPKVNRVLERGEVP